MSDAEIQNGSLTLENLRRAIRGTPEGRYVNKLHLLLLLRLGWSAAELSELFGPSRSTIEGYVAAANSRGLEGLKE